MIPVKVAISGQPGTGKTKTVLRIAKMIEDKFLIGGFTTHEAQQMIRSLRGLQLFGGDVVEVAPPFDPSGTTALVGASIMFEILCVVSESVASRK